MFINLQHKSCVYHLLIIYFKHKPGEVYLIAVLEIIAIDKIMFNKCLRKIFDSNRTQCRSTQPNSALLVLFKNVYYIKIVKIVR